MAKEEFKPMRIVSLIAENVQKLRAVQITPTGEIVTIAGRNDQGKTTVLNSIWMALDHTRVGSAMPIRKGENKARIRVDLGEIVVERRFTEAGSSLYVESANGARFTKPQQMLDALIGQLAFDPLAFAAMDPDDQFDELRRVSKLEVDIEELDRLIAGDFAKRADLNRDAKAKRSQADGIKVPADLPEQPLDEAGLLKEMETAAAANTQLEQRKSRRADAARDIADHRARALERRNEAAELRRRAETEEKAAADLESLAADLQKKLDEAPALPDPVDVPAITVKIEHARQVNAGISDRTRKAALIAEAEQLESQSKDKTLAIDGREKSKAEAIVSAKLPVEGLGFVTSPKRHITYNGIPFAQASRSVKLRVSLAIAMAANPTLRVIRIEDASLLDESSMAEIAAMAKEHDYQVWMEVVDSSGKVGVVIEDGSVVAVDGKPVEKPAASAAA